MKEPANPVQHDREIIDLDYIAEMLGFVRVSAEIAQMYCEISDDVGLRYQLQRATLHLKAALRTFDELEALMNAPRKIEVAE